MPARQHMKPAPASGATSLAIRFPEAVSESAKGDFSQDEEWFEVRLNGNWRRLRLHDYAAIYREPGLYEALVYDALRCRSPKVVARLLRQTIEDWPLTMDRLRVLDLGAGNGIMADELRRRGAGCVVGLDLLPEAAEAARRDRPTAYDEYLVADLTDLSPKHEEYLRNMKANCLATVAALGFGDIPPHAFANALNAVSCPGWLAMSIKEDFLTSGDDSGFSRLIRCMIADGVIAVEAQQRFCHRLSITGERLFYVALVARKLRDVPSAMVADAVIGHAGRERQSRDGSRHPILAGA